MASLPITLPREVTSVTSCKTKAERFQLLRDIQEALAPYDVKFDRTDVSPRDSTTVISRIDLSAMIDFDAHDQKPSMISWHRASRPLQAVPNCFADHAINPFHRRKATSLPRTYPELVDMLVAGFAAAADGSAFKGA
ncbi:hypothetical protein [Erythrobacter aureus]|uniref:Uncharacterized protein n=1 Tax=Erythrobacter aureus TaxID=2182384 RepID=A0A345YIY9_9SPHN|nr:hypothetical protein [Erythrobacter aureus]AXK43891.1 hypothetical protein DVR09_15670 [Erythrobacter aureus]